MFFTKGYDILITMKEKTAVTQSEQERKQNKESALLSFLCNVLRGVAIGVAFIIPGFSGGSVAAILGVYETIVTAISELPTKFRRSAKTLFPIIVGMILGVAALIVPIQWGLKAYPIPTVTLFVGLAVGGLPSVTQKCRGAFSFKYLAACLIPLCAAASLSFLPLAGEVDLLSLDGWGYLLLILVGALGSSALVVPGISGSMILLILGYYNPIVRLLTQHLLAGQDVGISLGVFACLGVGMVGGFFAISMLMKQLLSRYPRGTYFAILGFIVGSIPAIYISVAKEAGLTLSTLPANAWYWVVTALLFVLGLCLSLALVRFAKKKAK